MSTKVRRSVALAVGVASVFGTATALAAPASAAEVSPASVSRPAAPYDDVLDGWWDPANGGWTVCESEVWGWVKVYPNAGCIEAYRRGVYAIWLISDDGGIGT